MASQALFVIGASMFGLLGSLHLAYTLFTRMFDARDAATNAAMKRDHPVLTRRTTIWRAWVGFNASHSLGAMLFGAFYAYMAIARPAVLFGSPYLLALGLAFLAALLALAKAYWFRIPFRGILCATAAYSVALALRWA